MVTLSIITINYNNLDGLKKTAYSVAEQVCQDFEWIIIDGASSDGSAEYAKKIERPNSIVISEPDTGIYNAMNKGTCLAHGEYCLFLNSGDILFDNNVTRDVLNLFLADIKAGMAKNLYRGRIEGCKRGRHQYFSYLAPKISGLYFFEFEIPHQGTFIQRACLLRHPYDESYRIIADQHFFRSFFWLRWGKDALLPNRRIVAKYDLTGISNANEEAHKESERSFLSLLGPVTLEDYKDLLYGGRIERWCREIGRSARRRFIAEILLAPLIVAMRMVAHIRKLHF